MTPCRSYKRSILPALLRNLFLSGLVAAAFACSTTRTLPEGEWLYQGADIELHHPDSVKVKTIRRELEAVLAPDPNQRFLGLPLGLYAYNLFATEKEKGLIHWLQRRLGEPPVLYQPRITQTVERLLVNRSFNRGFFQAQVSSRLDTNQRKARVRYQVTLSAPYRIGAYRQRIDHPGIGPLLAGLPPSDILRPGQPYNLDDLKRERLRIAEELKRRSYFFFDPDYLHFIGDSLSGDRQVNLTLMLKEEAPVNDLLPMTVGQVTVYPDFDFTRASPEQVRTVDDVTFRYHQLPVQPQALLRAVLLRPGDRYDVGRHQRTQQRLQSLSLFQFVNLRFDRLNGSDSLLHLQVFLTPRLPHTIEGSAGMSYKSTRFLGPELHLTYTNRNLLGGAEQLRITASGNFNFPLDERAGDYFEEIKGQASLTRPGLLLPFLSEKTRRGLGGAATTLEVEYSRDRVRFPLQPDTLTNQEVIEILQGDGLPGIAQRLALDSTYAPLVGVNEFRALFGYQWQVNRTITHRVNPLRFRFQSGFFQDPEVEALLLNGSALTGQISSFFNLEPMVIYQPEYIFLYDSRRQQIRAQNVFYRGRFSYAGNRIIPMQPGGRGSSKRESQFLQVESDVRYFLFTKKKHTLAARLIANLSIPLGREFILPFFDFYSVGGPNSVRAFGTREVGPGTQIPGNQTLDLLRGKGDIQLESSVEYRYALGRYLELAAFFDAGNVWLFRAGSRQQGGAQFRLRDFYRELAAGAGLGLRINISGLILRLDLAVPLAKPWLPAGERWVGNAIRLGDPRWRKENLAFVLAFGYPF